MEETGKLAKACGKILGMHIDANKEINFKVDKEITNVINMAFAVEIKLKIDIEKEF